MINVLKLMFWVVGLKYHEGAIRSIEDEDEATLYIIDVYAYKLDMQNEYRDCILVKYNNTFKRRYEFFKWVVNHKIKNTTRFTSKS